MHTLVRQANSDVLWCVIYQHDGSQRLIKEKLQFDAAVNLVSALNGGVTDGVVDLLANQLEAIGYAIRSK